MFWSQFFGAFNDNVFKSAVSLLFVFGGLVAADAQDIVVNAAAALFILPYFLFSALAGQLADKYPKERLIRLIKIYEIVIAVLGVLAVFSSSVVAMLGVLFLLGVQSTFFGPLKFSILPQHLHHQELIGGNAQIEMGTFVSILLGTLVGGIVAGYADAVVLLSVIIVSVAVAGYVAARFIPHAPAAAPDLQIRWNLVSETGALMRLAAERYPVLLSIMGISWFWLIGSAFLAQFPGLTDRALNGDTTVVTMILCVFTLSIAVGSLLCEKLSGREIEIGLVPLGALGITLAGIHMFFGIEAIRQQAAGLPQRDWLTFLAASGSVRLMLDFAFIGVSGGLFIVPLYAYIQANTPADRRARIIAVNNIMNAIFMVSGSLLSIFLLSVAGIGIPLLLLSLILLHTGVTAFIFQQVPVFLLRFLAWLLSHSLYRVSHSGLDQIPEHGPALIVCNHVSYVDSLLLGGAVRRPIRFIMDHEIYQVPGLNLLFRVSETIPIAGRKADAAAYDNAMREIAAALEAGDLLCIFPEGRLTDDGAIDQFRRGVETIVATTPVPVVPMALCGLWGSWFSKAGGGLFRGRMRPLAQIDVVAGAPVAPAAVNADDLRERVLALRGASA